MINVQFKTSGEQRERAFLCVAVLRVDASHAFVRLKHFQRALQFADGNTVETDKANLGRNSIKAKRRRLLAG